MYYLMEVWFAQFSLHFHLYRGRIGEVPVKATALPYVYIAGFNPYI